MSLKDSIKKKNDKQFTFWKSHAACLSVSYAVALLHVKRTRHLEIWGYDKGICIEGSTGI